MKKEEKQLLALLKSSEDEGMRRIIDIYASPVNSICRHILRGYSNETVADAVQETFLKLWKYVSSGGTINKSLKSYIYQIARNSALDQLRINSKVPIQNLGENGYELIEQLYMTPLSEVHNQFEIKENKNIIHDVIKQMDEPNKTIFILKYFYNYTIREIAEKLNLKEDNVESKERRERKKVKKELIKRGVLYE